MGAEKDSDDVAPKPAGDKSPFVARWSDIVVDDLSALRTFRLPGVTTPTPYLEDELATRLSLRDSHHHSYELATKMLCIAACELADLMRANVELRDRRVAVCIRNLVCAQTDFLMYLYATSGGGRPPTSKAAN